MLFGGAWNLENQATTLTLEVLFAGMISSLDLVIDLLLVFAIFDVLLTSIVGVFWVKCA